MELKFLGRGAAFNRKEGNTAAFLKEGERMFLLDCGESVFGILQEQRILDDIKELYVVISHTHTDHCGSLGSLVLYCQFALQIRLKLIVPEQEPEYVSQLHTLMKLFGLADDYYEMISEREVDGIFSSFQTLRYVRTVHDPRMICHSFVFETSEGGIFYSADTVSVDEVQAFLHTHADFERIYMEATDILIPGDVHLYLPILEQVIPPELRDRVYLMHFRNETCLLEAQKRGFQIPDKLEN